MSSLDKFVNVIQTSLNSRNPLAGRSIHAHIIKRGLHFSVFLMNNLIHFYARTGSIPTARLLFEDMPIKNKFSWNTILSAYAKQGDIGSAHVLFDEMPDRDSVSWTSMIVGYNHIGCFQKSIFMFLDMVSCQAWPSQFTLTNILASCAATGGLGIGKKVHSFVVKLGHSCNVSVANSLLNMYAKTGDPITAKKVFSKMRLTSVSSWNAMITLHMQTGGVDVALAQFEKMEEKDVISWNSMIAGYNQHGYYLEALGVFCKMIVQSSLRPDTFTLASALSACSGLEDLRLGKRIHGYIVRAEFNTSAVVGNALISMYSKSGGVVSARKIVDQGTSSSLNIIAFTALLDGYMKLGDVNPARQIFDSSKDRDVVAWTAMIVGYVQNGLQNEAIELFKSMLSEGPRPNNFTLAAMLSVSSSLASLNHGKQIHASALRTGEVSSVSVGNALITMYSKSGNIDNAKCVFRQVNQNRDTVTWTSMIIALAQHGRGDEAIDLFEKMQKQNIKPDHITYVGVLCACTHVGLVRQGRTYFSMMQTVHKVEPTLSHYALMVDLFGRAGLLEEAQRFIKTMPIEPDVIVWGSLLSSCRIHKNVDLANIAAEKLLLLDPENCGAYAALANVYSACRKWDEAANIRKSMKDRKIKKEQGFSWVELKSNVHVFGVDDLIHPQRDAIYESLAKIWKEIKKMGFVPDTESVLHDLDEELKEQLLKHHSEKLAVAFALLNTPDGATVRIMKNIRVCNDCHSAIKYISKLVNREIIVRDVTRFHHFKDGFCSCRDYW
uniref:DYW domain-containing protein n=1 Tax=Kalanchoe fedtschenkoi TaxID=63787 RepID=A0A7N0U1A5_KALFE